VQEFSRRTRELSLERLATESFDVVVVGGGITGAFVALDAASRGLAVALVERGDFACGTSSRSSRFVHGGLRYIPRGQVGLVAEALHERARLRRLAPWLVRPLLFMIPRFRGSPRRVSATVGAALLAYDALGGRELNGRRVRADGAEAAARAPTLARDVADAHLYWEATVDDARLTMTVARTAALVYGAAVVNYCPVVGLERGEVHCRDALGGGELTIRTRAVVNATGVWSDAVRTLDDSAAQPAIRPAKGIHLAVPREIVPGDAALMLPRSGRGFVFTCPWGAVTLVGTTDADYDGPLDDPRPEESEIASLLDAVNPFLARPLERGDVVGAYAGLRPLVANGDGATADLSRKHRLSCSANGLVTVSGGKLTTARKMAVDTVDFVGERVLGPLPASRTEELVLDGAGPVPNHVPAHLRGRHGTYAPHVLELARELDLGRPLVDGLPYLEAEVAHAARYELAVTVEDVLARRTRAAVEVGDGGRSAAARIEELLAGSDSTIG
jgi:glycerol-3-phosphate dehydrogenase